MIQLLYMAGSNLALRRSVVSVDNGNWGLESPPRWAYWIQLRLSSLCSFVLHQWKLRFGWHWMLHFSRLCTIQVGELWKVCSFSKTIKNIEKWNMSCAPLSKIWVSFLFGHCFMWRLTRSSSLHRGPAPAWFPHHRHGPSTQSGGAHPNGYHALCCKWQSWPGNHLVQGLPAHWPQCK